MNESNFKEYNNFADDADLLRSLKPLQPNVNWSAIVAELDGSDVQLASPCEVQSRSASQAGLVKVQANAACTELSQAKVSRGQTRWQRIAASWWSGAIAGSLLTFIILQISQPVTPIANSNPVERQNATSSSETNNETLQAVQDLASKEATATSNNLPASSFDGLTRDPWQDYKFRHGVNLRMVSRTNYANDSNTSGSFSHDMPSEPSTAAALRRKLLDIN